MAAGLTYDEIRQWARWLNQFTAWDLADSLGVPPELGERSLKALVWHGIVRPTGMAYEGPEGVEEIFEYVPLPPGPTEHETLPPEWTPQATPGCYDMAPRRGYPIRLVDNTDRRNQMQGTGGARIRIKQRDKAYEAMQEANRKRAEKNKMKERARHEGKGFRLKDVA